MKRHARTHTIRLFRRGVMMQVLAGAAVGAILIAGFAMFLSAPYGQPWDLILGLALLLVACAVGSGAAIILPGINIVASHDMDMFEKFRREIVWGKTRARIFGRTIWTRDRLRAVARVLLANQQPPSGAAHLFNLHMIDVRLVTLTLAEHPNLPPDAIAALVDHTIRRAANHEINVQPGPRQASPEPAELHQFHKVLLRHPHIWHNDKRRLVQDVIAHDRHCRTCIKRSSAAEIYAEYPELFSDEEVTEVLISGAMS